MKVTETAIPDLKIIEPQVFGDERGYFTETWNQKVFDRLVTETKFVQDNQSLSCQGILRGLHFQSKFPQGKLVRVTEGEVFDVAVDLRKNSDTFGKWEGVILSSENKKQLWIPPGFAHGFLVLSEKAVFNYKCTEYYFPEHEHTLRWDDPNLNINWPLDTPPVLSKKDMEGINFSDLSKIF